MKSEYSKLLRDPRWQKKRLEIMQRDNFKCVDCECATATLNVHHTYYETGRAPWEYENASLITLCEDCHEIEHSMSRDAERDLIKVLRRLGVRTGTIASIAYFMGEHAKKTPSEELLKLINSASDLIFWGGENESAREEILKFSNELAKKFQH